jgi:hypothetical protein
MPEMIPVGNTGIQPDPLGSISKLIAAKSGMIGLQQQQQNLQTGQAAQQSAQATASQDSQKNQELQALAQFTKSAAADPSYLNSDGSANVQKYQQDAMKVAPVYGQAYIGQMTSNFNGSVENRKALLGLTKEQQGMVQGGFQSIAQGADATGEISRLRGVSDDKGYQNMLDNLLSHKPGTGMMPDAQGKQVESQWAANVSAHLGGPALATPSSIDTGGNIQPGTTSPYTGTFQPTGAIAKTLAPQVVTNPTTGGPTQVGGGPGLNAQPINGPGMQPTAGQPQIQADIDAARKVGDAVPINRDINQRILKLVDQSSTGPGTGNIHAIAAAAGLPSGSSYQELGAFLDRQAALAQQSMGLPNTNAGMETAKAFTGNTQYNNQVIKDKTHFVDALNTAAGAYRAGLDKVVGTGSTPNYAAYQGFRGAWAKNFDPNIFAYENAVHTGDTATQQEIEKDEGRKGMADLLQKRRALMSLANGQQ